MNEDWGDNHPPPNKGICSETCPNLLSDLEGPDWTDSLSSPSCTPQSSQRGESDATQEGPQFRRKRLLASTDRYQVEHHE